MKNKNSNKILKTEKSQSSYFNINKSKYILLINLIIVILLILLSLFTGAYDIKGKADGWEMFKITRVSRTLALVLTGASMSICGLVMQVISKNKMVEPSTTGTIEWAGLGLIFVYIFIPSPTIFQRTIGAIIFSFIGTLIFFLFLKRVRLKSSIIVPIVGTMLGAIISSISTFIGLKFNVSQILGIWFSGSFANIETGRYELLWFIVIITISIYLFADKLTVVGLGEDITTNLGLNYNQLIFFTTILISLAVGIVSSVIGNVPFLGLIVPNIVSRFNGDNIRDNLPHVCLLGISILLVCDIIARTIIMPFEVPVSLIMGTVGAFVFLVLLLNKRGKNVN